MLPIMDEKTTYFALINLRYIANILDAIVKTLVTPNVGKPTKASAAVTATDTQIAAISAFVLRVMV